MVGGGARREEGRREKRTLGRGRKQTVGATSPEHSLQEPVLTQDSTGMIVQWWEGWR